ncbi:MAG: hypothetical protein BXU00_01130 [Candidatus Nanoclepta minutus]|uniref:Cell wall-binding repeat 2 family protein n=1 Tax=Candidatus Nanoclepta minutus TaxID=1940235 RepID=A0A397WNM3_9ARCH|nr:MAG: hypothetical protein BXU00_01130 [Candidatus Nanoclepta minutus]
MRPRLLLIFLFVFGFLGISVRADTVIATTNITFADTILAKVVSEIYDIPQVIVGRNAISNDTLNLLRELNATDIIIIGGPAVVSYNVEDELKSLGYRVTRIWGVTRFETSALVAKFFWSNSSEAVILTGELTNEGNNFRKITLVRQAEDLAIEKGIPILIVPPGEGIEGLEHKDVLDALLALGVKKVYIFSTIGNLSKLTSALDSLNISYEVVRYYQPRNCTPIRIAVPADALWNETPEVFIYKRCVELVPVEPNVTLEDLRNMNISIVLLNLTDLVNFRKAVKEEMKEKVRKEERKMISLIANNILNALEDIAEIAENASVQYRQCYNETIELLKDNKTEEAFIKFIECLRMRNEYRWRNGLYIKDSVIKDIREMVKEMFNRRIRVLKNLTNLTEDIEIRDEMPDPMEVRNRIMLIKGIFWRLRNTTRNNTVCIQVITCATDPLTGKAGIFPTPCDVPQWWEIVPCERIIDGKGRVEVK